MIKSKNEYPVKGKTERQCLNNIEKNVESRVNILRLAEAKAYGFPGGKPVEHLNRPGVKITEDPLAYFNSVNNPKSLSGVLGQLN